MTTVGVVVPTLNSGTTLWACLESLRAQTHRCEVVVVDNHSVDSTVGIARPLADRVIVAGPERSAQRNCGAALLNTDVLGFVDSDMTLAPQVVAEAVAAIDSGADAVIVPERTVGAGYWAAVRAFERSFYVGDDHVEAARFFRRALFVSLGGFDEQLDAAEDWDLTIRARQVARIGRTAAMIEHHEGRVTYLGACAKKGRYAVGLSKFRAKHGSGALGAALSRRYIREPWRLLVPHPMLGAGLVALKGGEAVAVAWELVWQRNLVGATVSGTPPFLGRHRRD